MRPTDKSEGKIPGLNKRNCSDILLSKGFYKNSKPWSFSKWLKTKRIHIQLRKSGFEYHYDEH